MDANMKNQKFGILFSLILIPSLCIADAESDLQQTADLRKKILSHLQDEMEYNDRDSYGRSVLNQILPRIATSVVVCDGQLFIQDAEKKSMPVQIYEDSGLDINADFEDNSHQYTTADKLNGFEWKGGASVKINFDTYKPLNETNWTSNGSIEYDYGIYNSNLVIKNGQLLKPQQGKYESAEEYRKSTFNRLVELNQYPPLTCEAVDKSIKNYKTKESLSNGLNVILGIASIIQNTR